MAGNESAYASLPQQRLLGNPMETPPATIVANVVSSPSAEHVMASSSKQSLDNTDQPSLRLRKATPSVDHLSDTAMLSNVLAVSNSDLADPYDEELRYRQVAYTIHRTRRCQRIQQMIRDFYYKEWVNKGDDDLAPRRFFVLAAPSGAGKTQMAFSLQNVFHVLHVALCVSPVDSRDVKGTIQPVYDYPHISEPTLRLCEALEYDAVYYINPASDLFKHNITLETVLLLSETFGL